MKSEIVRLCLIVVLTAKGHGENKGGKKAKFYTLVQVARRRLQKNRQLGKK